jgi:fructokinase
VLQAIKHADWIKASDEDLHTLLAQGDSLNGVTATDVSFVNAPHIADALAAQGCRNIALTCGGEGALLQVGDVLAHAAAPRVTVADTVGCGDTFWGTCLVAWASGETTVETTLHRAMKAAAINATRAGCHPPTAAELR